MKLPILNIKLPRNVTAVHQIEITSRCNLRCVYCPSPQIMKGEHPGRPAMDMTRKTYEAALRWVTFFVRRGTQGELNLAGIGESTLHDQFVDFVRLAREAVGDRVKIIFATNGLIHDEAMIEAIRPYNPRVWVSLHRPEKAGLAVEAYKRAGLLDGISNDPSINAYDWAGQVKWFNTNRDPPLACQWIREGKMFVQSNGRFATCCVDATGQSTGQFHVGLDPEYWVLTTAPYELCRTCNQEIAVEGYNQRGG